MRQGDKAKLAPEQEQALLEKLRRERLEKSHALLQKEAQNISAKMAGMEISAIQGVADDTSASNAAMACAPLDGNVALVLNLLLRTCSPPVVKEPSKKGGKKQNAIKAAAAKIVEGDPPESAQVRKVLKANKALLAKATKKTPAGMTALLKAIQSWLVSPQGANACATAAKTMEVLYDTDLVTEDVFMKFWDELQAQLAREAAELVEATAAFETLTAEKAKAEEEMSKAGHEQADAAWHEKQAEAMAQVTRCGGNPSKEDELAEKNALATLKKCKEYSTQASKVLAARTKDLTEVNAEFETSQSLVEARRLKGEGGGALFTKHTKPFFEWLAAPEEDSEEEEKKVEIT